jgi:hypothetical protein
MRRRLGLFANLRPVRTEPALAEVAPYKPRVLKGVDLVFVRELSGGVYFGEPRGVEVTPSGTRRGINTHAYTEDQIERAARFAFALARGRRGRLTSVDKANVMEAGALWRSIVTALQADEFRDVELDHMLADTCALMLSRDPARFDVILTDNLFGDVLSDARGGADRQPRHAALRLALRARRGWASARALRAGARCGAGHRRQGSGESRSRPSSPSPCCCAGPGGGDAARGVEEAVAAALAEGRGPRHRPGGRGDGRDGGDGGRRAGEAPLRRRCFHVLSSV